MKRKVLVIDDSKLVLAVARDVLEDAGYEVYTAASGLEGNSIIFSRNRPDLIILDVMLPILNGDKAARILKGREHSRDIPVLLMSSKPEEELRKLVLEAGAEGYVRKPFSHADMVKAVRTTLRPAAA